MTFVLEYVPYLTAMLVLMAASGFFSASEAALFYLTRDDREWLTHGGRPQRRAVQLLKAPERLLTSILFWNLVINIAYFALASRIGISLERGGHTREAYGFTVVALVGIILLSEMLPKNLAVLWPRRLASLVSLPLTAATRLLDPVIPTLQAINRISLRTIVPKFEREPYLELRDLERAITLSTPDKKLAQQEELVLHQIVSLSEIEAEELMRPRRSLTIHHAPVSLEDLRENPPTGDFLLVAEPDSEELERAMTLAHLPDAPPNHLEEYCEPVAYVPWCATGSVTLDLLQSTRNGIAAVVNEHGETIGVVTFDDVLHMLFANPTLDDDSRPASLVIQPLGGGRWRLSGATTLRRLAKHLKVDPPTTKSVTVAGMLQEQLERFPEAGDEVRWGRCRFEVIESPQQGIVTVVVELLSEHSALDSFDSEPRGNR